MVLSTQVKDATEKFLGRQTVESSTMERRTSLRLPVVAVCPGFKRKPDGTYHVLPSTFEEDMFNNELFQEHGTNTTISANETMDWWRNVTYSLEETVTHFDVNGMVFDVRDMNESYGLRVREAWTGRGRCYVVTSADSFSKFEYLGMTFRSSTFDSIGTH